MRELEYLKIETRLIDDSIEGRGLSVKKNHEPLCMESMIMGGCWCEHYLDVRYTAVRYTIVNRSRRMSHKDRGLDEKKPHDPVFM